MPSPTAIQKNASLDVRDFLAGANVDSRYARERNKISNVEISSRCKGIYVRADWYQSVGDSNAKLLSAY